MAGITRDDQRGKLSKGSYTPTVQAVSDLANHVASQGGGVPWGYVPDNTPDAGETTPPSGGGGGGAPPKLPDLDWSAAFFGSLGLPADIAANINKLFSQYSDTNSATAAATAYIRGTPWYDQTFPGIKDAMSKGIVQNETDYRNLLNTQNQYYKQYLGRDISSSEFASNLGQGVSNQVVSQRLQGQSLANTYGNDWRYTLGAFDTAPSDAEVTALGQGQAGLDSPLAQQLQRRLQQAQQRLSGVFSGTLAQPSLSAANGRLSAPSLLTGPKPSLGA